MTMELTSKVKCQKSVSIRLPNDSSFGQLICYISDFPIPHPDLQNIIDKTAAYVLKNGREFEDILRTKNDARFSFLSPTDEYHRYYIYKVSGVIYPTSTTPSTQTPLPPPIPSAIPFPTTAPKVISKFVYKHFRKFDITF